MKLHAKTLSELVQRARFFFSGPVQYEPDVVRRHGKARAAGERPRRRRATLEDVTAFGGWVS